MAAMQRGAGGAGGSMTSTKGKMLASGHDAGLCDLAFSEDGKQVLTCGGEGQVLAWDVAALVGGNAGDPKEVLQEEAGLTCMALAPSGEHVITASADRREVKRWSMSSKSMRVLTTCAGTIHDVAVSPSESLLAVATSDTDIRLVDIAEAEDMSKALEYRVLAGHTRYVKSVVFDPREQLLASTSADGTLGVWRTTQVTDAAVIARVTVAPEDFDALDRGKQTRPAWSPDGSMLAVPSSTDIKLFRRGQWHKPVRTLGAKQLGHGHDAPVIKLAWADNGSFLASAGADDKVMMWDLRAGAGAGAKPVHTYVHDTAIHGLALAPTANASPDSCPVVAIIDADGEMACFTAVAAKAAAPVSKAAATKTASQNAAASKRKVVADSDSDSDGEEKAAASSKGAKDASASPCVGAKEGAQSSKSVAVLDESDSGSDSDDDMPRRRRLVRPGAAAATAKADVASHGASNNISALKATLAALDDDPTANIEDMMAPRDADEAALAMMDEDGSGGGPARVQPPFQPNATPMVDDGTDIVEQFLAFNRIGSVKAVETAGVRHIAVSFADTSANGAVRFPDSYNFVMAALSPAGVALASQGGDDEDDGLTGSRDKPCTIMYHPFTSWAGTTGRWTLPLPDGEIPDVIACGDHFVAVATSKQRIRLMTTSGVEAGFMALPGPIVTMVAQGPLLAIVHAVSSTQRGALFGYTLLHVANGHRGRTCASGTFCLDNRTRLTWAGFTSYNMFVLFDSEGVLHGLTNGFQLGWSMAPIAELGGDDKPRLWPVDVQQHAMAAVKLSGSRAHPATTPTPLPVDVRVRLPMLRRDTASAERAETAARGALVLAHRRWCHEQSVRLVADMAVDVDSSGEEDEGEAEERMVRMEEKKIDKCLLTLINNACRNARLTRALDLSRRLNLTKSLGLAVKLAQHSHHTALAKRMHALLQQRQAEEQDRARRAALSLLDDGDEDMDGAFEHRPRRVGGAKRPLARSLALTDDNDDDGGELATPRHKRPRTATAGDDVGAGAVPAGAVPAGSAGPRGGRRKRMVMVGGERRSKVREEEQQHAAARSPGSADDIDDSMDTPRLQRRQSLLRGGRPSASRGSARNPFAKRTAASPQKKNRHVLDSLVQGSPSKPLHLRRSSSFAVKARLQKRRELTTSK